MLPDTLKSTRDNKLLETVDCAYTIYTLRLSHYIVSASINTSPCSMREKTVVLYTESGYNIIFCSVLPLNWQYHVCPDYKILPVGDANGIFLQLLSAVILHTLFESAFYKTNSLIGHNSSLKTLIFTVLMKRHVNSIRCID